MVFPLDCKFESDIVGFLTCAVFFGFLECVHYSLIGLEINLPAFVTLIHYFEAFHFFIFELNVERTSVLQLILKHYVVFGGGFGSVPANTCIDYIFV